MSPNLIVTYYLFLYVRNTKMPVDKGRFCFVINWYAMRYIAVYIGSYLGQFIAAKKNKNQFE